MNGHSVDGVGMTSLAVLAFLSEGHTFLSKEVADGFNVGDSLRRAIEWLLKREAPDGRFQTSGDPALSQALGALTLTELSGMTGSPLYKDAALKALGTFSGMQQADGSWGDIFQSLWAAEALASAKLAELGGDGEPAFLAGRYYQSLLDAGPSLPAMIGDIFVNRDRSHPSLSQTALGVARTPPQWSQQSFDYWYLGSLALFQYDGPQGSLWRSWSENLKQTLVDTQQSDGTWPGAGLGETIVRTSLGQLTLAIYNRASKPK